jgi:hypothetical protein
MINPRNYPSKYIALVIVALTCLLGLSGPCIEKARAQDSFQVDAAVTAPRITSYMVSPINATYAAVTWYTDQTTRGVVNYGTSSTNLNLSAPDEFSSGGTYHYLWLRDLAPRTNYYFQVVAFNGNGMATTAIGTFKTPSH